MNHNGTNGFTTMNTTNATTEQLVPFNSTVGVVLVSDLNPDELNDIRNTQRSAMPANTKRTYHTHVREFAGYCAERGWAFTQGLAFAPDVDDDATEPLPNPARVEWVLAHLRALTICTRQRPNDVLNANVNEPDVLARVSVNDAPNLNPNTTVEHAPETVTGEPKYGVSLSTLDGRIRALNAWHKYYGYTDTNDVTLYRPNHPAVVEWFRGYRNELARANANGQRKAKEAPGVLRSDLRAMVRQCDTTTLAGLRDRALLLIGWNGAFRRCELVEFVLENMIPDANGRGFTYPTYNTKTNKTSAFEKQIHAQPNDVELCPVVALNAWVERAGITPGPDGTLVFRSVNKAGAVGSVLSARMVDKIVREYDNKAGINKGFSGHSLRAGYATQATLDGVPDAFIRAQGWADSSPVVFRYQRRAERFTSQRIAVA